MAIDAVFLVVEHRTQTQFGFQAAEYGLKVGQHREGPPHLLGIPGGFVAAQAIDARMGQAAALDGLLVEVQRCRFFSIRIGDQFDGIVPAGSAALFLQPAQPLVELGQALLAPRF